MVPFGEPKKDNFFFYKNFDYITKRIKYLGILKNAQIINMKYVDVVINYLRAMKYVLFKHRYTYIF